MMTPRWPLGVRRLVPGAKDAHGNPIASHAPPVEWLVYAYAPGANEEQGGNSDVSLVEWTVYAPVSDDAPGEFDLVRVEGVDYAVEGRPADWTRGPWENPLAGLVVQLKKVA
jgi:hypothetical protein